MTHCEEPPRTRHRYVWLWWLLALGASVWLLWMTLRPNDMVEQELFFATHAAQILGVPSYVVVDLIGNIVAFVPVGAALALALGHRRWRDRILLTALLGAALSLCIELLQLLLPTRVPGLDDWILNTGGAALGASGIYLLRTLVLGLRRRTGEQIENPD